MSAPMRRLPRSRRVSRLRARVRTSYFVPLGLRIDVADATVRAFKGYDIQRFSRASQGGSEACDVASLLARSSWSANEAHRAGTQGPQALRQVRWGAPSPHR